MKTRTNPPRPRLGDLLKEVGAISDQDLKLAISEQHEQKDRSTMLGELLLQKGFVSKEQLATALQKVTRVPYVDCTAVEVDRHVLDFMTRELALRYCCLPTAVQGRKLVLVMTEPQNLHVLDEIKFLTGMDISPRLGFQEEIKKAIDRHFPVDASAAREITDQTLLELEREEEKDGSGAQVEAFSGTSQPEEGAPLDMEFFSASSHQRAREAIREFQAALISQPTAAVRLVSNIIYAAENKKASDIHIDPQAMDTIIRLRVDGILRDLLQVPQELSSHLISRIKILADLDIAERRAPQDGRFLVRIGERRFDLRVSTLPTHYGEKVVIRLLTPEGTRTNFVNLGFSDEHSQALLQVLAQPQGLVLVCGPTGSGKSTTLYAALNHLRSRAVNIITVEDPVEHMLEGVNQVQVNSKTGLTFAGSLRSILRQDPNIVMVGEIRDKETAEIAMTAAQTGHLVLTTLHTNDSIAAIDRLRDLGIPSFLISSSISAIVSQRLVRKLCSCRVESDRSQNSADSLWGYEDLQLPTTTYMPGGCEACDNTGYKGRVGVFETFIVDNKIRRLIQKGQGTDEIRALVEGLGFNFMLQNALEKIRAGLTSLDEVLRIIPMKERSSLPCTKCGKELVAGFLYCPYCGSRIAAPKIPKSFTPSGKHYEHDATQ